MEKHKKLLLFLAGLLMLAAFAALAALPLTDPAAAAPLAPTPLATPLPTSLPRTAPPLSLTLMLGFTCCAVGAVLGILVLGFVLGIQRRKDEQAEQKR